VAHREPYYGKAGDKPAQAAVFAGREFRWATLCFPG
jgi:hypothetical protein